MILNYLTQKQLVSEWCWAAVASSVSFFYHKNEQGMLQGDVAGNLIDPVCQNITKDSKTDFDPSCNKPQDIADALKLTGNFAWEVNRALTFNEIVAQVNEAFPICCQIYWSLNNLSHYVAIYGYQNSNLIVGDPEGGIFQIDAGSFTNYRQGQWVRTIGTQQISQTA